MVIAELVQQLRAMRKNARLTQAWIARRIGVTETSVGAWEAGTKVPSARHLAAWADVLGVRLTLGSL